MKKILVSIAAICLVCTAAVANASSLSFDSSVKVSESTNCWGIGNGAGVISCATPDCKPVPVCNPLPSCNPFPVCAPKPVCNPIPVCNPAPVCTPPKSNSCDFLSNCNPIPVNCDGGKTKTIDCGSTDKKGGDCGGIQIPTATGNHCQSVPEPASMLGLLAGVGGFIARKRKKTL